jgi:hypothetical protein
VLNVHWEPTEAMVRELESAQGVVVDDAAVQKRQRHLLAVMIKVSTHTRTLSLESARVMELLGLLVCFVPPSISFPLHSICHMFLLSQQQVSHSIFPLFLSSDLIHRLAWRSPSSCATFTTSSGVCVSASLACCG